MIGVITEFPTIILGSLKMSDAVIALISAMMTTVGLAIVKKLMDRPAEHWQQALQMREELRSDLVRAHEELARLHNNSKDRDMEFLELKSKIIEVTIQLRIVSEDLKHCQESHDKAEAEFERMRKELGTCVKSDEIA